VIAIVKNNVPNQIRGYKLPALIKGKHDSKIQLIFNSEGVNVLVNI